MRRELDPIPIGTTLVVAMLESGRALVRTIADPSLVAYGEEHEALLEQRLFLAEHLRRHGALLQARFSLPESVELVQVPVAITPPSARARDPRDRVSVAMPCAVLPDGRARWAVVLPLGLSVYVGPGEDLASIVASEAERHVGVWAPDPFAVLQLLPDRSYRLERVAVEIARGALPEGGDLRRRLDRAHERRHALGVLGSVGRRVREEDCAGPEPVGLEEPLAMLDALASGPERRAVLLVGEERGGKTSLVRAWIRKRASREGELYVYATSGAQLVAGMSGLGQWQERLRRVMQAAETLDAVLWLDDLRDLFGDRAGGHVDLPSAIKPWLEEGRVRLIGELTPEAADLFATRQAGLFSQMLPIRIEAGDARAAREALERALAFAKEREPVRPRLEPSAISAIVELTDRYLPYRPFPGKAVRLYEELRSSHERKHAGDAAAIGPSDVYSLFSAQSGIPAFLLRDDLAWRAERAREHFEGRIVGQREAIAHVVDVLCLIKAGLAPRDKPLASFLFCGPTGVGKTELSRALAELLFGSADRLLRFDMSEHADALGAERLIRGSGRDDGELTSRVRQQPFCVVLLDEIEKAHPAVFDLLLQVLGEGRLTDARGRTAFFHNAIVVMTSNLGTRHRSRRIGIAPPEDDERARVVAAVEASFRPELVNRIDRIVAFHALGRDQIREIADHFAIKIATRRGLAELGVSLDVTDAALDRLADAGFAEAYGARALRRHFDDELTAPVARLLARLGARARGARVTCRGQAEPEPPGQRLASVERDGIAIDVVRAESGAGARDPSGASALSELRRWARGALEVPTVVELRERAAYLVAELNYGKRNLDGGAVGAQHAELSRLRDALGELDAACAELESVEELALAAFLAGESVLAGGELESLARRVRAALLAMLLAPSPRHAITLVVQEHDRQRPFDRWLGGLLAVLPARGWQLEAHVHRDPGPLGPSWPADRAWGPPRSPEQLLERLGEDDRGPLYLLLRVRGPYAGDLLALEAGLHRHPSAASPADPTTFAVRAVAMRAALSDADFARTVLKLGPVPAPIERRLAPAVRETVGNSLAICGKRKSIDLPLSAYWERFDEIALEHLLLLEPDPDERALLYAAALDTADPLAEGEDE